MATIQFKAKVESRLNSDGSAIRQVKIPKFNSSHCNKAEFRLHPKYGAYANSDLFSGILARIRKDKFGGKNYINLDQIPQDVLIDESGFLAIVTITV
jgi:hypothetical protein